MKPAVRKELHQLLLDLQRELATKGAAKLEPNRKSEVDAGEDEDEQPLNEMLQSVASGRNRHLADVAAKTARALAKLRDDPDDFGLCEDCGDPIPLPRLRAMPFAEYCVACQAAADGPRGAPTRKKLTDYR